MDVAVMCFFCRVELLLNRSMAVSAASSLVRICRKSLFLSNGKLGIISRGGSEISNSVRVGRYCGALSACV